MARRIVRIIIVAALIIGVVALVASTLLENQKTVQNRVYLKPDMAVLVQTFEARPAARMPVVRFVGSFVPNRSVQVTSETNGKVEHVGIQKGSAVATGHLIARLDDDLLQAQLASAKAALVRAQAEHERVSKAVTQLVLPRQQLDNAVFQLRQAEAQVTLIEKQITQTLIHAPFAGYVTDRKFDLGSVLAPGTPLADLVDISSVKLRVMIPERNVLQLRPGQQVPVHADLYPGSVFTGAVTSVSVQGDATHSFEVEVQVPNPPSSPLRAGMYGSLELKEAGASGAVQANAAAQVVPRKALVGSSKKPAVYVVEGGRVTFRHITIDDRSPTDTLVVTQGLKAGDIVVVGGQINLREGLPVQIAR